MRVSRPLRWMRSNVRDGIAAACLIAVFAILFTDVVMPYICDVCMNIGCWYCWLYWCGCS